MEEGEPRTSRKIAQVRSARSMICRILMLDDTVIEKQVDKRAVGQILFDEVCDSIDLMEKDYFGLTFIDPSTGLLNWVNNLKKLWKQIKGGQWDFTFRVKFYPPDPQQLHEDITRYQLCLQIRRDIVEEKVPCSFVTYTLLGSYTVQSELGDYDVEEFGRGIDYLRKIKFAPHQDRELCKKIADLHKTHRGQTPEEAELHFLENAKKLGMYGVELHQAKDAEGVAIDLGVSASGLLIFKDKLQINKFVWPKVLKMSYRRNKFYVKLRPGEFEDFQSQVGFKLQSVKHAKRMWKICVEHHSFFRFRDIEAPKPKSGFPRFGSRFRYSGRTQFQTRQAMSNVDRPSPYFDRVHSKRATYGGRPTARDRRRDREDYRQQPSRELPVRTHRNDESRYEEEKRPPPESDHEHEHESDHERDRHSDVEEDEPRDRKSRMAKIHAVPTPLAAVMAQNKLTENNINNRQRESDDNRQRESDEESESLPEKPPLNESMVCSLSHNPERLKCDTSTAGERVLHGLDHSTFTYSVSVDQLNLHNKNLTDDNNSIQKGLKKKCVSFDEKSVHDKNKEQSQESSPVTKRKPKGSKNNSLAVRNIHSNKLLKPGEYCPSSSTEPDSPTSEDWIQEFPGIKRYFSDSDQSEDKENNNTHQQPDDSRFRKKIAESKDKSESPSKTLQSDFINSDVVETAPSKSEFSTQEISKSPSRQLEVSEPGSSFLETFTKDSKNFVENVQADSPFQDDSFGFVPQSSAYSYSSSSLSSDTDKQKHAEDHDASKHAKNSPSQSEIENESVRSSVQDTIKSTDSASQLKNFTEETLDRLSDEPNIENNKSLTSHPTHIKEVEKCTSVITFPTVSAKNQTSSSLSPYTTIYSQISPSLDSSIIPSCLEKDLQDFSPEVVLATSRTSLFSSPFLFSSPDLSTTSQQSYSCDSDIHFDTGQPFAFRKSDDDILSSSSSKPLTFDIPSAISESNIPYGTKSNCSSKAKTGYASEPSLSPPDQDTHTPNWNSKKFPLTKKSHGRKLIDPYKVGRQQSTEKEVSVDAALDVDSFFSPLDINKSKESEVNRQIETNTKEKDNIRDSNNKSYDKRFDKAKSEDLDSIRTNNKGNSVEQITDSDLKNKYSSDKDKLQVSSSNPNTDVFLSDFVLMDFFEEPGQKKFGDGLDRRDKRSSAKSEIIIPEYTQSIRSIAYLPEQHVEPSHKKIVYGSENVKDDESSSIKKDLLKTYTLDEKTVKAPITSRIQEARAKFLAQCDSDIESRKPSMENQDTSASVAVMSNENEKGTVSNSKSMDSKDFRSENGDPNLLNKVSECDQQVHILNEQTPVRSRRRSWVQTNGSLSKRSSSSSEFEFSLVVNSKSHPEAPWSSLDTAEVDEVGDTVSPEDSGILSNNVSVSEGSPENKGILLNTPDIGEKLTESNSQLDSKTQPWNHNESFIFENYSSEPGIKDVYSDRKLETANDEVDANLDKPNLGHLETISDSGHNSDDSQEEIDVKTNQKQRENVTAPGQVKDEKLFQNFANSETAKEKMPAGFSGRNDDDDKKFPDDKLADFSKGNDVQDTLSFVDIFNTDRKSAVEKPTVSLQSEMTLPSNALYKEDRTLYSKGISQSVFSEPDSLQKIGKDIPKKFEPHESDMKQAKKKDVQSVVLPKQNRIKEVKPNTTLWSNIGTKRITPPVFVPPKRTLHVSKSKMLTTGDPVIKFKPLSSMLHRKVSKWDSAPVLVGPLELISLPTSLQGSNTDLAQSYLGTCKSPVKEQCMHPLSEQDITDKEKLKVQEIIPEKIVGTLNSLESSNPSQNIDVEIKSSLTDSGVDQYSKSVSSCLDSVNCDDIKNSCNDSTSFCKKENLLDTVIVETSEKGNAESKRETDNSNNEKCIESKRVFSDQDEIDCVKEHATKSFISNEGVPNTQSDFHSKLVQKLSKIPTDMGGDSSTGKHLQLDNQSFEKTDPTIKCAERPTEDKDKLSSVARAITCSTPLKVGEETVTGGRQGERKDKSAVIDSRLSENVYEEMVKNVSQCQKEGKVTVKNGKHTEEQDKEVILKDELHSEDFEAKGLKDISEEPGQDGTWKHTKLTGKGKQEKTMKCTQISEKSKEERIKDTKMSGNGTKEVLSKEDINFEKGHKGELETDTRKPEKGDKQKVWKDKEQSQKGEVKKASKDGRHCKKEMEKSEKGGREIEKDDMSQEYDDAVKEPDTEVKHQIKIDCKPVHGILKKTHKANTLTENQPISRVQFLSTAKTENCKDSEHCNPSHDDESEEERYLRFLACTDMSDDGSTSSDDDKPRNCKATSKSLPGFKKNNETDSRKTNSVDAPAGPPSPHSKFFHRLKLQKKKLTNATVSGERDVLHIVSEMILAIIILLVSNNSMDEQLDGIPPPPPEERMEPPSLKVYSREEKKRMERDEKQRKKRERAEEKQRKKEEEREKKRIEKERKRSMKGSKRGRDQDKQWAEAVATSGEVVVQRQESTDRSRNRLSSFEDPKDNPEENEEPPALPTSLPPPPPPPPGEGSDDDSNKADGEGSDQEEEEKGEQRESKVGQEFDL